MHSLHKHKKTQLMGELPEGWKTETIGNVSQKLVVGFVGTCDPFYTDDKGVPMIRTTNVKEGRLNLSNLKYVTREFHEKNKKSQLKENDLLVARHGENGAASLVRGLKEANCLSVVIIRPDPTIWIPEYFEFAFNSAIVRNQIGRRTGGGVQTVVNTSEIAKVSIPIPSLKEQQKIANILSTVYTLIQKIDKTIEQTQILKKGLMQRLLTKGIKHIKFKTTEVGDIPEIWNIQSLGECVDIISGEYFAYHEFSENGIPVLKIDNVSYGSIDWTTKTFLPERYKVTHKHLLLHQGDIVLALNRPITNNEVKVGMVSNGDAPSLLYQRVGKFKLKSNILEPNFFYMYLTSPLFKKTLSKSLIGSDQPYVKTTELKKKKIAVPPIQEQKNISICLFGIKNDIESKQIYKNNLITLRKGLMQQLLTGKIRVRI